MGYGHLILCVWNADNHQHSSESQVSKQTHQRPHKKSNLRHLSIQAIESCFPILSESGTTRLVADPGFPNTECVIGKLIVIMDAWHSTRSKGETNEDVVRSPSLLKGITRGKSHRILPRGVPKAREEGGTGMHAPRVRGDGVVR